MNLTPQQTKALQLAANGLKVSEISETLGVSVRTVEAHLSQARDRLGARNTTEAAVKGVRAGLIWSLLLAISLNSAGIGYPASNRVPTRITPRVVRNSRTNTREV